MRLAIPHVLRWAGLILALMYAADRLLALAAARWTDPRAWVGLAAAVLLSVALAQLEVAAPQGVRQSTPSEQGAPKKLWINDVGNRALLIVMLLPGALALPAMARGRTTDTDNFIANLGIGWTAVVVLVALVWSLIERKRDPR